MIDAWPSPSKLLNEGEHVVVSTRTHPKALMLPLLVLVVLLAVGVVRPAGWASDAADVVASSSGSLVARR